MSADRLREMLSEATPGPWFVDGKKRLGVASHAETDLFERPFLIAKPTDNRDAAVLALAPDAIALLADAMDELEKAADTFDDFAMGLRLLGHAIMAEAAEISASHIRETGQRLDDLCGDER